MFKLTVGVNEGALSIVPSSDKFLEAVEDSISEAITIIDIPERLLTHADLAIYVTASSSGNDTVVDEDEDGNGGEDLITLITQTQDYQYCRSNILSSVSSAFDEVVEYSEIFEPYKNTYNENVSTEANMRDMFKDVPLETFKTYIEKWYLSLVSIL